MVESLSNRTHSLAGHLGPPVQTELAGLGVSEDILPMIRYHIKQAFEETAYSITHPRRRDWFEFRYAWLSLWGEASYPFKKPFYFLQTVWAYRKVLWDYGDWDQAYLFRLLEVKFRLMKKRAQKHRIIADWESQAREYMICENLMRRLAEDDYCDLDSYISSAEDDSPKADAKRKRDRKREEARRKQDIEFFCNLFRRKVQTWWD